MNKMSNLDLVLDEMITSGKKMIEAANELKKMFSDTSTSDEVQEPREETPAKEVEAKKYSFQEVRGIMATLAGAGKKAEAKALLTKYGASRLSDVKEEDYPALVAEAEVLTNG